MAPTPPGATAEGAHTSAYVDREALVVRLSRCDAWRALQQLEAREAVGDWLDVVEGGELRRSLEAELASNPDYRALRALEAPPSPPPPLPAVAAVEPVVAPVEPSNGAGTENILPTVASTAFKTRLRLKIRDVVALGRPATGDGPPPVAQPAAPAAALVVAAPVVAELIAAELIAVELAVDDDAAHRPSGEGGIEEGHPVSEPPSAEPILPTASAECVRDREPTGNHHFESAESVSTASVSAAAPLPPEFSRPDAPASDEHTSGPSPAAENTSAAAPSGDAPTRAEPFSVAPEPDLDWFGFPAAELVLDPVALKAEVAAAAEAAAAEAAAERGDAAAAGHAEPTGVLEYLSEAFERSVEPSVSVVAERAEAVAADLEPELAAFGFPEAGMVLDFEPTRTEDIVAMATENVAGDVDSASPAPSSPFVTGPPNTDPVSEEVASAPVERDDVAADRAAVTPPGAVVSNPISTPAPASIPAPESVPAPVTTPAPVTPPTQVTTPTPVPRSEPIPRSVAVSTPAASDRASRVDRPRASPPRDRVADLEAAVDALAREGRRRGLATSSRRDREGEDDRLGEDGSEEASVQIVVRRPRGERPGASGPRAASSAVDGREREKEPRVRADPEDYLPARGDAEEASVLIVRRQRRDGLVPAVRRSVAASVAASAERQSLPTGRPHPAPSLDLGTVRRLLAKLARGKP